MGKSHRDNHAARKKAEKRGVNAFAKKAKRRKKSNKPPCSICGEPTRVKVLIAGVCPRCASLQQK